MKLLGLYQRTSVSHYEGGGSDHKYLLATDTSAKNLRERWNAVQKKQCIEYGYRHRSYFQQIDPPFIVGKMLTYPGGTGGGCASVSHTITIEEIPQWDESK